MAGQLKEELVLKTGQFSQGINSAISEVEKLKKKGNELGSGFDKSLGGIISKLKGFNAAALVGLAAGKAIGEAMKRNATINEYYEKSIATCKSGLETFYNTLSSGNWSNFISNFEKATESARNAYEALKELENTKIFSQVRLKQLQNAYDKALRLSRDRNLSEKERIKYLENARRIMLQQVKILGVQLQQQQKLAKAKFQQALNEVGIDGWLLESTIQKLGLKSQKKRDAYIKDYESKREKAKKDPKYNLIGYNRFSSQSTRVFNEDKFVRDNYNQSVIVNALKKLDALGQNESFQSYLDAAGDALDIERQIQDLQEDINQSERKVNAAVLKDYEKKEKVVERIISQWQTAYNKSLKFTEELQKVTKDKNVNDNTRISSMSVYDKLKSQKYQDLVNQGKGKFTTENNGGIKTHDKQGFEVYFKMNDESVEDIYTKYNRLVQRVQEAMKDSDIGILSAEEVNATIEKINEEIEKLGLKPLELHVKTDAEKALSKVSQEIGQVASAFGQLGQAFEEPALNVAAVMAQAIATIIEGYATATAEAATLGPWAWLGFSLTALGELASIISSVKSMGQYANGGVVGGSSYSGDKLYARVNSGEMILNSQQQSHLFNMINNGGTNAVNGNVKFVIKGTDLQGVLNNYNHKMGKVR